MSQQEMKIILPKNFKRKFKILNTLQNPTSNYLGILIAAENFYLNSVEVTISVFLLRKVPPYSWIVEEELQSFVFSNYNSALNFSMDLPHMSALDLLIVGEQGEGNSKPQFFN